ncbi:bifunctional tRNA (5-methylaminomethyl-2-thiouridine)(34)-methyltransferase MnmD/FAD-dependent 5-carboxymethylaminomethyl-2-thiouridine(34) oxidoreductase MnmC [Alginatibacterium sediminis]|uniref:tRNA 5-methylaminomethyl-2-thiouridine biosynthesis bifunctional protein MnmC n=1 Tax=Alginatibacterium sediminis TaxID=2164068 RepID=A0A420EFW1_9ALTE|nr:bifunctional tRNA (5-methylaminomethyl-2-thiouridine)(34)-methyltransferase MnmD/FAD-dependent 5-carboxymethylaminomethyl-2-thiouridine(34) oxidoreductase MnmC [Alginatibacterium sediminis]RKF19595.1 bifunctional tRNA (5-methylaminomethyl-2-thiouridine)(34)-methyltransferase MnmD/FAD-dependent 5-carboxymethylaminomethyl-2-thiouridine(34) oxidoreductase MnmC [Alginatibacterium sediminis]
MQPNASTNTVYQSSVQYAKLDWNDEQMPVATDFEDVYFSKHDGLEESRYVFLAQNRLSEKLLHESNDRITIAESGFGTGLNLLACCELLASLASKKAIHFISFEKYPLRRSDLKRALQSWPSLKEYADELISVYPEQLLPGCNRLHFHQQQITLDLWIGDIQDSLSKLVPHPEGLIDCWFLDGFSPTKNPEMWNQPLFDAMAFHSKNKASFATFTAAGFVRRGLQQAGFTCEKTKGFAVKRHMLRGHYLRPETQLKNTAADARFISNYTKPEQQTIAVIGAGIAGCNMAYALTRRGFKVCLLEQEATAAQSASGNPQGAIYPLLLNAEPHLNQFYWQACAYQRRLVEKLSLLGEDIPHQFCGVFESDYDLKSETKHIKLAQLYQDFEALEYLDAQTADARHGLSLGLPGLWHPNAGWLSPAHLCQALLNQSHASGNLEQIYNCKIESFRTTNDSVSLSYHARDKQHSTQERSFSAMVVCNGHQIKEFSQAKDYPIQVVGGQIEQIHTNEQLQKLNSVICYKGYLTPANQNLHCLGASHRFEQESREPSDVERQQNVANLGKILTGEHQHFRSRVSVRGMLRDHCPMVGPMPDYSQILEPSYRDHWQQQLLAQHPHCYCFAGLGARGLSTAALGAEVLASELAAEAIPLHTQTFHAMAPGRMLLRRLRKNRPLLADSTFR